MISGFSAETPVETMRAICEDDPVAPRTLCRGLPGDVDAIVLKALRKEPERRYATAKDLRSDLISWLSGDRIMARPDSLSYQIRRFVKRHPVPVALTAAVIISSVVFTFFHLNRITAERDLARLEAQRRQEVSDFLVNLLKVPDPTQAGGEEVTARELLADALPRIQEDLTDPETRMRMLGVVAEVNQNLGLFGEAYHARAQLVLLSTELHADTINP